MLQRCFKEVKAILLSLGGASIKSTWGAQLILTSLKEDSGNERQIVRFRRNSSETASRFHNSCLFVMPSSEAKDHQAAVRDVERAFPTPDEELTHPALPCPRATAPDLQGMPDVSLLPVHIHLSAKLPQHYVKSDLWLKASTDIIGALGAIETEPLPPQK